METQMEKTNIRTATTKLSVEGILAEKNLEEVTVNGNNVIKGNVTIQTSPENQIIINVYVNKITKAGGENKSYKGIETVMNTYQSIAEVGLEEATRVIVRNGQIEPNTYFNETGVQNYSVRYKSNFFSSAKGDIEPKANFDIEMYVSSIIPEVTTSGENAGEETGRIIVKGIVPIYSGCETISLIVSNIPDENGLNWAELISNSYEPGMTGMFYGKVVNEKVETVKLIPMLGGTTREEKSYKYNSGLLVVGASEPYGEENPNYYSTEIIQKGMAQREIDLAEKKKKAMEGGNKANTDPATKQTSGRTMPRAMF